MLASSPISIRTIAAAMVIAMHVLLLLIFESSMRRKARLAAEPVTYMMQVTVASQPAAKLQPVAPFHFQSETIVVPEVSIEIADTPISAQSSNTEIDWRSEASRVAKEAAKPPAAKRFKSFGVPEDPCDKADPLNEFKPKCKKEEPDFDWNPNTVRFGFGKRPPPNGHLFDHLKPEYLKKPVEEICSKTMANCNHNSSSSAQ